MRVVSVQVGRVQTLARPGGPERTAIDKRPTGGPVRATAIGLEGDETCDRVHHGGPDRAVLFASRATYPVFEARLARPLPFGSFGENLTVEGLTDADVCIGDRLRAGDAEFEVSSPRSPCGTLARHLGDPGAVDAIGAPHRAGWYARVVREGRVGAGADLALLARPHPGFTVARVAAARRDPRATAAECLAIAALPELAAPWIEKMRTKANGA